jgi:hypothetical protein
MSKITVCDLINNVHTQFTEADREWLSVLHEDQLAAMVPVNIPTGNSSWDEIIANAPVDVKERLDFVQNQRNDLRAGLFTRIKANTFNKFTDEQLGVMSDVVLQNLADSFAPIVNYVGASGAVTANQGDEVELVPTMNEQWKAAASQK